MIRSSSPRIVASWHQVSLGEAILRPCSTRTRPGRSINVCPLTRRSRGARTCGGTETWSSIRVCSGSGSHTRRRTAEVTWLKNSSCRIFGT